jgi:hypothetical protein
MRKCCDRQRRRRSNSKHLMTSLYHESRDRLSTTAVWSCSPLKATAVWGVFPVLLDVDECHGLWTFADELHIVIASSQWYRFCIVAFLGEFVKLRKATVSFVMSVPPSAWNNSSPIGQIFMKFYTSVFFGLCRQNSSFIKV